MMHKRNDALLAAFYHKETLTLGIIIVQSLIARWRLFGHTLRVNKITPTRLATT